MIKKFLICTLFFSFTPALLAFTLYFGGFFSRPAVLGESTTLPQAQIFTALPQTDSAMAVTYRTEAAAPVLIENYLHDYDSPLFPYAAKIVEAAEKYGVRPQLIVAVAQQESNLGKKSPPDCYNAWGWGIHERGTKCFSGWEEAIEVVTRGIARSYCAKGLCDDPCLMMKKYTPKSNGSWCAGVNQFLNELSSGEY